MKKKTDTRKMAMKFFLLFAIVFLIVTGRFLYIQAKGEVNNVSLKQWAEDAREITYPIKAERGKIYDNAGVMLAYDRPVFRVYAVIDPEYSKNKPKALHVEDANKTAEQLAPYLKVNPEQLSKPLDEALKKNAALPIEKKRFQIEFGKLGKNISQKTKNEIEKADIPGIYFIEDAIRYYPNGIFASHILGFARATEDGAETDIQGVSGMEKVKNDVLAGKDGYVSFHRDKYNKKLLNANEVIKESTDGNDIHLTINQKVQTLLEDVLTEVVEKYKPEKMSAVIMNPKTGEIVAMSNRPSYNPNKPENVENWYNDIVSTPIEPGSTVKMFTWAAAIDSGNYNGNEGFMSGKYQINPRIQPVNDHNGGNGWGVISYDEGFRRSSNVAASRLVWEKIGPEKYMDYLKAFDFDKKTNIDLPNEVIGKISYNYPRDKITTGFGQSTTLSPIQQMKAATAIANDGKMMKPFVIKKIVDPETGDVIEEHKPEQVSTPIKKETANQVLDLLGDVVNGDNGTGKNYQLKDYTVAGKTGTAQMPDLENGGYLKGPNSYIFSFLGMVPKDDPELMMYVSVSKPKLKDSQYGGIVVEEIFKNVMENSLKYLNIEPENESEESIVKTLELPALENETTKVAKEKLTKLNIKYTIIGNGNKIAKLNIPEKTKLYEKTHVILVTDKPTMPNLEGWSKRDVLELKDMVGFELELIGEGFVSSQNIKIGEPLNDKTKLKVKLVKPF